MALTPQFLIRIYKYIMKLRINIQIYNKIIKDNFKGRQSLLLNLFK